jgi:hypothetical protein
MAKRKHYTQTAVFKKYGIRSGLEETTRNYLEVNSLSFEYETLKLNYIVPEKKHKYTPDFVFPNKENPKIIIETKGRWVKEDREKMKLIKDQYPELDIRMIFSNSNSKINKKSKTTYADICKTLNIPYADKHIPIEWVNDIKKIME